MSRKGGTRAFFRSGICESTTGRLSLRGCICFGRRFRKIDGWIVGKCW